MGTPSSPQVMQCSRPAGRRELGHSDRARLQLLELLLVLGPHLLEQPQCRVRLVLVDLRQREADVYEHPVAELDAVTVVVEQPDVDRTPDAGDSTFARRLRSSTNSTTCPGIARHIGVPSSRSRRQRRTAARGASIDIPTVCTRQEPRNQGYAEGW